MRKAMLLVLLVGGMQAPPLDAQVTVSTTAGGNDAWGSFLGGRGSDGLGGQVWRGFGQIFTAPSQATTLNAFSVWTSDFFSSTGSLQYRAFLATWTGASIGRVVWSDAQAMPAPTAPWPGQPSPLAAFQQTSFSPGTAVIAGAQYAAFIFPAFGPASGFDQDIFAQRTRVDAVGTADGQGGLVSVQSPGNGVPDPSGASFANLSEYDLAFEGTFGTMTVVTEPRSDLLVVAGLLLFGLVAWRRPRPRVIEGLEASKPLV